jgi:Flp pilus assembly protein TadD
LNPLASSALENLGLIALEDGRVDEALELLERATGLQPHDPVTHLNLAKVRLTAGDRDGAEDELREAVRVEPDHALAHARLAQLLAVNGDFAGANRHARKAIELEPDDDEVRRSVDAIARIAEDRRRAIDGTSESALEAAVSFAAEGRADEARRQLAVVLREVTDSAALVGLAHQCFVALDREIAIELLRMGVAERPSDPVLQLGLGRLLREVGSDRDALAAYNKALAFRPTWADAGNDLALLLATASDPEVRDGDEALRIAQELVAASKRSHPLLLGTLGIALASTGDRARADSVLAEAISVAAELGGTEVADHLQRYRRMVAEGWPPPPDPSTRTRDAKNSHGERAPGR